MSTSGLELAQRRRAVDVLREQLAPQASDAELEYLAQVGQRLGLDPIAGHIVLIPRWDSRVKKMVHRPQITADGRLVLADRTGELDGFSGPEWTGPREKDGSHAWVDVWDEDFPPHAARVFVYRKGRSHPVNGTVRWFEFAQTDSNGNVLPTWKQMPSHMLGKVALSLGIRRAFPGIIPTDLDVEVHDDFEPYERESTPDEGGADQQPTSEGRTPGIPPSRRAPAGSGTVPSPASAEALVARIGALSREDHHAFGEWQHSRRFSNAPAEWSSAVRGQIARELDRVEAEAAADAQAYDDETDE
jgi:hypothetical protein